MKRKESHINSRKKVQEQLKKTVCQWLQWDDLQYGLFQYECGLAYLRHYITHDQWGQDMLQRSRLFWNWWKNQWSYRDASFCDVEGGTPQLSVENLRRLYYHLHDAAALASEIYPGRMILDDTYNSMIHSIHKEELHAQS